MTDATLNTPDIDRASPFGEALTEGLGTREMAIAVYALYMATVFTGGLSALGGVVIAYAACRKAPSVLRSHYAFQIRTFWTGVIAAAVGAGVLAFSSFGLILLIGAALYVMVRGAAGLGRVMNNRPARAPRGLLV
jgi:uncharacterized membrane protein